MKKFSVIALVFFINQATAQHLLSIPDTISGTTFNLTVHPDSVQFSPGTITQTLGVNSSRYLGPTLIMRKGDSVSITVNNQIGDTTTMHWHGLHVAPKNDGGPFSMIMNGMSWNPQFVVRNNASTYWYHPHMMKKTAAQAIKGDAGMIIVRDNDESALALPRRYGLDDFPIIVQCLELDGANQFMPRGMQDSVVLVNGTDTPYVDMPAQVVRMRLLNASGERSFNFGFTANQPFKVIGNDGGLLTAPVSTTRIRLSPGERAEILLDLDGMLGQTIYLMSYASELPIGVQGGPTMSMPPGSPPMNSPLNGLDFNILQINVVAQTVDPVTSIPSSLVSDAPYTASMATGYRRILMSADDLMIMDGPFYFNGNSYDMSRIDYRIPLDNIEIWTIKDSTMVAHPFHLHDVHFYILDRDGVPPSAVEAGRKDVFLIQSNETVRFIAKFNDFADTTTPYMYHCHILMHEDDGMMGQFLVGAEYTGIKKDVGNKSPVLAYPNPAKDYLLVQLPDGSNPQCEIEVYDLIGQKLNTPSSKTNNQIFINTAALSPGMYFMKIKTEEGCQTQKFIKE